MKRLVASALLAVLQSSNQVLANPASNQVLANPVPGQQIATKIKSIHPDLPEIYQPRKTYMIASQTN